VFLGRQTDALRFYCAKEVKPAEPAAARGLSLHLPARLAAGKALEAYLAGGPLVRD
jgi:hypothetical protein